MRLSRILGSVVATLVVAATGLLAVPVAPATADPMSDCAGRAGVVVVVDFGQLGGGVTRGCDGASGHTAAQNFAAAGYHLTYSHAPGMNGFVCTVQGKPANGDCTSADAYWSLWWSDGRSGTWTYSSLGADSLDVPAGGYVAFAWHQGTGKATGPGVQPTSRQAKPTPTPTPTPTAAPTKTHHHVVAPAASATTSVAATPTSATASTATTTAATAPAKKHHHLPVETPAPLPSATSSLPSIDQVAAGPPADASAHDTAGPGTWIAIGLGVLVIGGAAAVPLLRRRRG